VMTHSGDLISAPDGAEEFVDIRLDAARTTPRWRYLVPAVYRYSGPSFGQLPEATLGWMLRSEPSADRATFDPATVVNAFRIAGRAARALPILIDLEAGQVIYVDVGAGGGYRNSVESAGTSTAVTVAAAASLGRTRVAVSEVVRRAVVARGGTPVDVRADADLTVGLDPDCTIDVLRNPQRLMAELVT
jgi:hypothetical protein